MVACADAFLRVLILQDSGKTRELKRETRKRRGIRGRRPTALERQKTGREFELINSGKNTIK
jgi:hypothetical protein